ncbi:PREDICTED: TBC1 domain family member 16 [Cyphomyrmex costatus]|uniref:TBC1 domain family member 16 n=1 Tax=Cyphomyrmex costatus TaxID=456900 RepID=A0A195CUM8_9HYME|nr:PREDICTED: TBC1 domain family member 16 [Cyphomyrmex costatus]KYN04386.1 TBC1 domain family member 16 [Cyphomyrmex costatus]
MPLPNILRKASNYILGECGQDNRRVIYQDGEALFCKNNVCVHPPTLMRQHADVVHHPGYMTITCKLNKNSNLPTLHLSWIPNSTLRKHPTALENLSGRNAAARRDDDPTCLSSRIPENTCSDSLNVRRELENENENENNTENDNGNGKLDVCLEAKEPVNCGDCERVCSSSGYRYGNDFPRHQDSSTVNRDGENATTIEIENRPNADSSNEKNGDLKERDFNEIDARSIDEEPRFLYRDDVSVKSRSLSLTSTCSFSISVSTDAEEMPSWMRSPELLALQHNLVFPESATASPVTLRRAHRCRRFSVDLSEMRSLRLFFADPACTCGQLVVASRESQYKILHFHHGGLDRLAATLHQWHQLLYPRLNTDTEETLPYRHFMVCRPEVSRDELHPEEGQVPMITSLAWKDLLNERGQMEDDLALRKGIFFGGLEPALRKIVWPFLLHCYSYQSTYEDREQIDAIRRQEYEEIQKRRLSMNPEQAERFWRNVVCIVEKDVVRTDRANPYYAGEGNPNVEIMKNILLNYAVYNCRLGYTQGMSDLLAPLLAELNSEIEAFWCFAGLMQRSVAVCTPTDTDMDRNLCYLRELVRIMVPDFYTHLQRHADALELLFCHRWILLCLKREFPTEIALVMWEACWVNYLTDHFHLFLCLAIMCVYADDVIAQDLRTDEMLLHFSSLAMYMDGNIILRKARGLLHHFRQLVRLPCTLAGLCRQCGPGMWDSAHDPVIECVGHEDTHCPYLNNYE